MRKKPLIFLGQNEYDFIVIGAGSAGELAFDKWKEITRMENLKWVKIFVK